MMSQPVKINLNSDRNTFGVSKRTTFMLLFLLLASFGCIKNSMDTRILQPGTKCNIYAGVFATGAMQPALPVTVVSVYRAASSGLIYYNVKDSNGVVWQIPDNDLQVLQ